MKGQMEIIGLVFIVVFLVLGLLIYVSLSGSNPTSDNNNRASFYGTQLETAMLETSIPECPSMDLGVLLSRCMVYASCGGQGACQVAYETWDELLSLSLGDAGDLDAQSYRAYILDPSNKVLFIDGEEFIKEPFDDCNENSNLWAAPRQMISTDKGVLTFVVEFCT